MADTTISFAGRVLQGTTLEPDEQSIINSTVNEMLVGQDDVLTRLFQLRLNDTLLAAQVAKAKLANAKIRGQIAGDGEIGMQLIRPGHVLRSTSTTETPVNNWSITFASGNQNWIGYGSSYATAMNMSQFLTIIAFGVMFTQGQAPVIEELFPQVGNTSYPGIVVRQAWVADNNPKIRIAAFYPMIIEARQTSLWTVNAIAAGTNEMQLLGVSFGYGRYLRKTSYAAADLP